jgi:hypothetical protein
MEELLNNCVKVRLLRPLAEDGVTPYGGGTQRGEGFGLLAVVCVSVDGLEGMRMEECTSMAGEQQRARMEVRGNGACVGHQHSFGEPLAFVYYQLALSDIFGTSQAHLRKSAAAQRTRRRHFLRASRTQTVK